MTLTDEADWLCCIVMYEFLLHSEGVGWIPFFFPFGLVVKQAIATRGFFFWMG